MGCRTNPEDQDQTKQRVAHESPMTGSAALFGHSEKASANEPEPMSSCSLSTTNQGSWSLPYSAGGGPPVEDGLMSLEVRPSLSQIWSNTVLGPLARGSKRSVQLPSDPVREGGFEPPRPFGHRILSPARLPGSATLALKRAGQGV